MIDKRSKEHKTLYDIQSFKKLLPEKKLSQHFLIRHTIQRKSICMVQIIQITPEPPPPQARKILSKQS